MMYGSRCNNLTFILLSLALPLLIAGCRTPQQYKEKADTDVYNIIDRIWEDKLFSRANYKISDTKPLPQDLQVEKSVPDSGILSLAQALQLATAHNRDYQTQKETLYLTALQQTSVSHQYDFIPFGQGAGSYLKEGQDEGIGATAALGFNKLLYTGAFISTQIAANWMDIITGNMQSGLSSILSASITQPVLRGYGRQVVMENLTQVQRDTLYQLRLFNRFRKTFVVSVVSQYYHILQLYDEVKNARANFDTLNWMNRRAQDLATMGMIPQYELNQIYQDALQAHDTLVLSQKMYQQALDGFKITLSLPTQTEIQLDEKELDALRALGTIEYEFQETEAIQTTLAQRLDLANKADAVDDAKRKVAIAADALRAELNLVASASEASSDERTDIITFNKLEDKYGLGVQLDLPLDRLEERNLYRTSLITLNQRRREYEQASDMAVFEVRQAFRDLSESAQRYKLQTESLTLARKRFDNTIALLSTAQTNTRDVLDAQRDLFRAQNASTQTLVEYTIAFLRFYQDTGVLRVQPDGMWVPQLAAKK